MGIKSFGVILALSGMVSGCIPLYAGYEQNMYAPGGTLADKNEGPAILASATDASLAAMFPKGTKKAVVMQTLGNPQTSSTSTGGKSTQLFTHTFTSYARQVVDMQMLMVEYDENDAVSKLTLTRSNNKW
jgi:outer membrane protein assembly factor BamE (lipoprotein component of BamABCDE complex)